MSVAVTKISAIVAEKIVWELAYRPRIIGIPLLCSDHAPHDTQDPKMSYNNDSGSYIGMFSTTHQLQ